MPPIVGVEVPFTPGASLRNHAICVLSLKMKPQRSRQGSLLRLEYSKQIIIQWPIKMFRLRFASLNMTDVSFRPTGGISVG